MGCENELARCERELERTIKLLHEQLEHAWTAAHVLIDIVGAPTHEELDRCGCEDCEYVRKGLVNAGYLEGRGDA